VVSLLDQQGQTTLPRLTGLSGEHRNKHTASGRAETIIGRGLPHHELALDVLSADRRDQRVDLRLREHGVAVDVEPAGDSAAETHTGIKIRVVKPPTIGELGRALRTLLDDPA
jgi:hypothetical protein